LDIVVGATKDANAEVNYLVDNICSSGTNEVPEKNIIEEVLKANIEDTTYGAFTLALHVTYDDKVVSDPLSNVLKDVEAS